MKRALDDFSPFTEAERLTVLLSALCLTYEEGGLLLQRSVRTIKAYAQGERHVPPELLRRLEAYVRQVEHLAEVFIDRPERAARAAMPRLLFPAVRLRMMVLALTRPVNTSGKTAKKR